MMPKPDDKFHWRDHFKGSPNFPANNTQQPQKIPQYRAIAQVVRSALYKIVRSAASWSGYKQSKALTFSTQFIHTYNTYNTPLSAA